MKNKNKKKILRFFSILIILSTVFVAFAFPISALDIGGGATMSGIYSECYFNGHSLRSDNVIEYTDQIVFQFNFSEFDDYSPYINNVSFYAFDSSVAYGTLSFSIKISGSDHFLLGDNFSASLFDTTTKECLVKLSDFPSNTTDYSTINFTYTGYIPSRFYIQSFFYLDYVSNFLSSVITYKLSFTPRDPVSDKFDEEKYPSFGDSQDKIDDSQQIEDDSLNNANGFIDSAADFVFDRSLWTEGKFINGLRIASTTFENFASIPFIGTILKYAVIFGLIGFVLGLATFVMRRRK